MERVLPAGTGGVGASARLSAGEVPGHCPVTVAVALHAMLDAAFVERQVTVAMRGRDGVEVRRVDIAGVDAGTCTLADIQRLVASAPTCSPHETVDGHLVSTVSLGPSRCASTLSIDERTGSATLSIADRDGRDVVDIAAVMQRAWRHAIVGAGRAVPLQELFADDRPGDEPVPGDSPDLFVTRFTAVCQEVPDRIAIDLPDGTLTYRELESLADSIAWQLERRGIGRGSTLFVLPQRDRLLVATLVAAFKVGATLALASPGLPAAYLRACADAAGADLVVDYAGVGLPGAVTGFAVTGAPTRYTVDRLEPNEPAFVTFTSGTSGAPKAVLGRYGSLTYFFDWMDRVLGPLRGARFGMCSSLGHDPLQRDIMTPLYLGGTICVPNEPDLTDVGAFPRWLAERRIGVICVNPSAIGLMTGAGTQALPALRQVFCVGAALTRGQARDLARVAPNARVVNLYGSTETQRAVGYYRLPASRRALDALPLVIPIGAGMKDVELLVVTAEHRRCLPFQLGQIVVRSAQVGLAYVDDPELTAARFRTDVPAGAPPRPAYLTGDTGYHSPRHGVVFAGRQDNQVKINGHRVELEQVTEVCRDHPLVRDVATVPVNVDGHLTLATYLVPTDRAVRFEPSVFRESLAEKLPGYMVPQRVTTVPELPLTRNHKLDTGRLVAWASTVERGPTARTASPVGEFVRRHSGLDQTPADVPLANLGIDSLRFASLVSQAGPAAAQRDGRRLHNMMTLAEVEAALAAPASAPPGVRDRSEAHPAASTVRRLVGHASRVTETTVEVRGRRLDHLCSNSYLGFGSHPAIRDRVAEFAARCASLGSHGSAEVNGHTDEHERLAVLLRQIFGCPTVTLFSSGYLANVSAIPAVAMGADGLFIDEYSHRSIVDGCVLSGVPIHLYRHNDPSDLAALLRRQGTGRRGVIVSEAVFGSTGDVADLPSLVACAREFGCTTYIDEASSLGQLGPTGRGIEEHFGMPGSIDVRSGSLAKALASNGGFVCGSEAVADSLRAERGATFATAISPIDAFVAAEAAALLLDDGARLAARLHRNRDRWRDALREAGFDTGTAASAVVPILAGGDEQVTRWFTAALDAGALTLPLLGNWSTRVRALRTTVTAAHDPARLTAVARRIGAATGVARA